jgi:cell fate (sporulation/competence/biofilm development) regulator YlbF (YheA/YmcA/DUF963 family)
MDNGQALIELKTRELCEAIVASKGFSEMFQKMEAFMTDELAKFEFQMVNDRAHLLREKQAAGSQITQEELSDFEAFRDSVLAKSVAADFLEAQEQMQQLQKLFYPMLSKTFELGRVPVPDDFLNDCCNEGCGSH